MEIIVMTSDQVRAMLDEIVRQIVDLKSPDKPDTLSLDEAVAFLCDQGYKISKSQLYKKTSAKQIPFYKFGNRIVFKRQELLQ